MIGRVSTQNTHYNAKPVAPPSDFYIATMVQSTNLIYLNNISSTTFSMIDLQFYSNLQILNSHEILRYGNDIHIIGNYGSSSPNLHTLKLKDCKLIKNRLLFQGFEEKSLSTFSSTGSFVEASGGLSNGYLYLTAAGGTSSPTKILKVDKDNLNDISSLTFGLNGFTNNIIMYNGYIYTFNTTGTGLGFVGSLIRTSLDLATYSVLFTTGAAALDKRIRYQTSFTIHNNEIYIPMVTNTASGYNRQGLEVYNMSGVLLRSVYNVPINSTASNVPNAKWVSVYNDKLIISNSSSQTTTSHFSLVRMDIATLAIEESIKVNARISDDNSIFSDGYIYLNGEPTASNYNVDLFTINTATVSEPSAKLIKIKYNDFTDITYLTPSTWGYGSYGSITPLVT